MDYKMEKTFDFEGHYLQFPEFLIQEGKKLEDYYNKILKDDEFICDSDVPDVQRYLSSKALETFDNNCACFIRVMIPFLEDDIKGIQETVDKWKNMGIKIRNALQKNDRSTC